MKIEIFPWKDGKVGYRFVGNNGEVMLQAEGFASEGNARRAIKTVKDGIKNAPIVLLKKEAKD